MKPPRRPPARAARGTVSRPGSVRIIGGRWRGSRLPVADLAGLRPTPDRHRETLFNWLQAHVPGSRCLDLFAGSGALGLEAASRGAQSVVLVERDRALVEGLRDTARRLGGEGVEVVQGDALGWLEQAGPRRFDLVFLDPPFASDHWDALFSRLAPLLHESALVYVESAPDSTPATPPGWSLQRSLRSRGSSATLYRAAAKAADTLQP